MQLTTIQLSCFEELTRRLTSPLALSLSDFPQPFGNRMDASNSPQSSRNGSQKHRDDPNPEDNKSDESHDGSRSSLSFNHCFVQVDSQ
ncbi:hypothetical protein CCR75_005805 [Bremia lactucae]|uniref:Uncharacterized protein n=1 Tax=Bremia lactucae TaxID=4779 RepID=A0A976FNQ0_BRELC|nr:hypothetical protein CCR75_005805 [Bremia lactucae]